MEMGDRDQDLVDVKVMGIVLSDGLYLVTINRRNPQLHPVGLTRRAFLP